jgi:hypothetical protein
MHWIFEATSAVGAGLLQIALGLLIEELTFGGLVRLILAHRPGTRKPNEPNQPEGNGSCLR